MQRATAPASFTPPLQNATNQRRSFCYVDELIEGIVRLSQSAEHMPVNIGNPNKFTILECAQAVLEVTGSNSEIEFEPLPIDDPTRRRADITKAQRSLGWEPLINLKEGLQRSLAFYEAKLDRLSEVAATAS